MKLQRLMSLTRQAIDAYKLIQPGDKIAVGLSGGKDSIALLHSLKGLQRYYPYSFELIAVTVDLGFEHFDLSAMKSLCDNLDIEYHIQHTDIGNIIFNHRSEKNPCSLCSKLRKGAMYDLVLSQNCNKVALGHHKEDIVETMLLSLLYEGRFHTFSPSTYLDRTELTVIRPLMYVSEKEIIGFMNLNQLTVLKSPCPADGHTKRNDMKILLKQLNKENPGVVKHMFKAIQSSSIDGWNVPQNKGL